MKGKINDKIEEIEEYLSDLNEIRPDSFEDYENSKEERAACEHYFEKIVEAVEDLAFLVVKDRKIKVDDENKIFDIIADNGVIKGELALKLKDAKGMRNIIAHEYGEVDDEVVFEAIQNEIEMDVREFLENIKKLEEDVGE